MATKEKVPAGPERITIEAPKLRTLAVQVTGTAPYVQSRFGHKNSDPILAKHLDPTLRNKKTREAKVPADLYEAATHRDEKGICGIPASAFRNAMIDACRLVGYQMTRAKMSVFILADGVDQEDEAPLVHIRGNRKMHRATTRNDDGSPDIRFRPMWRRWSAVVRMRFDSDQFTERDVVNLLMRAGEQVGIGEGRPFSKNSNGCGWGTFTVESKGGAP